MTYGLHRMLQPWSEGTSTWNERLPGVPWTTPGARASNADFSALADATGTAAHEAGWVTFDITAHVQALSTTIVAVNNGWRLQPISGATSSLKRYHSGEHTGNPALRPRLVVSYR